MASPIRYGMSGHSEQFAAFADSLGVDLLTWGDSAVDFPDPYISLARAAGSTERALLGTSVLAPGIRHPAVLANQLVQIQDLSEGRHVCAIGTGDLGLYRLGEKPMRLDDFIAYTSAVRGLAAGRTVAWNGHALALGFPIEQPVPVWYAADGPRLTNAAAAHADGILVGQVGGPDVVRTSLDRLLAGTAAAGRKHEEVEAWFMLRVVPTKEDDAAIDIDGLDEYATRAMRYLWRTAGRPAKDDVAEAVLRFRGFRLDDETADRLWEFNSRYDDAHAFGSKKNVQLMDEVGLRRFAGRYFFISGRPGLIKERVQLLIDAGARNFIAPVLPWMAGDREQYAREISVILESLR
jgi:alkanesulfonate monooxygenase SsuD/methylene tetrahydromethanopterin reductase-like flavin-dependent oxidoreductase (luciferase family)